MIPPDRSMMMQDEAAKLVELKVMQLDSVQTIGIIWWVVSCALSYAILAGVWKNAPALAASPVLKPLCRAVAVFFLAIVSFGTFMVGHSVWLAVQFKGIPSALGPAFCWDSTATAISYAMATSIFIVTARAWFALAGTLSAPRD